MCVERMQLLEDIYPLLFRIYWSIAMYNEFIVQKSLEIVLPQLGAMT